MDDYYKLAAAYFKEFEPRSSFPGLKSSHWYLWALSLAFFIYFGYEYFFESAPTFEQTYWGCGRKLGLVKRRFPGFGDARQGCEHQGRL